jgi:hypothetical protein
VLVTPEHWSKVPHARQSYLSTCLLPSCAGQPRALEQGSSCQGQLPVYLSATVLPCCAGRPRALEQVSSCQVPVYLSATLLCWSNLEHFMGKMILPICRVTSLFVCYHATPVTKSIGARFLVLARVTYLPVCYPVTLVKPEHFMGEIFLLVCRVTSLIPCCTDQTQSILYPNSMEQDPTCLIELPFFPST